MRLPLVAVGKITAPHGTRGDVRMIPLSDFPERYSLLSRVMLSGPAGRMAYDVESARWHKGMVILKLTGIDSRDTAEMLRGAEVLVRRDELPVLPEGSYWIFDLVGLEVVTTDGETLGVVVDVLKLPANDVYVVQRPDGKQLLLPATREVVRKVDSENGTMTVYLLPGLVE
ncbi:MAG: ribosome maturation factor RimM [Bacillota bacterium]